MSSEENLLIADPELLESEDDDDSDLFIRPVKKHKILMLSDHQLSPSGVGIQARILIDGLVATGKYSFRCLGGAIKHADYNVIQVNPDFIIKPVDGFGNKNLIRQLLLSEKPDAILIFTDPRQFTWLWEMEDEIHQICPIAYWHVWDNDPYPAFNSQWYESTDLINCISQKTFDLVSPRYAEKTNYIPHAFPKSFYHKLSDDLIEKHKKTNFGPKADWFKVLWVNRNAQRKVPADVMTCWKLFLDEMEVKHGHSNAVLIMHTDPYDMEGPNLLAVAEQLGLQDKVWFSTEKLPYENMNMLHNITDCLINVSKAEGFGLSTLISLQVGKPIIALKTGGETSKVVDPLDGFQHGVAIEPCKRLLMGSQQVPYIYEDFASTQDVVSAFMTMYEMPKDQRDALGKKCIDYVDREFNIKDVISKWDSTLTKCIEDFKKTKNNNRWTVTKIGACMNSLKQQGNSMEEMVSIIEEQEAVAAPNKPNKPRTVVPGTKKRTIKVIDPKSV